MVCLKHKINSRLSIKVPDTWGSYFWERSAWCYPWWFLGSFFRTHEGFCIVLAEKEPLGGDRLPQSSEFCCQSLTKLLYFTYVTYQVCCSFFLFACLFACFPRSCCNSNLDHQEMWCKAKRVSEPSCCSAFLGHRQLFPNWVLPFKLWVMVITFGIYLCGLVLSSRVVKLLLIP